MRATPHLCGSVIRSLSKAVSKADNREEAVMNPRAPWEMIGPQASGELPGKSSLFRWTRILLATVPDSVEVDSLKIASNRFAKYKQQATTI